MTLETIAANLAAILLSYVVADCPTSKDIKSMRDVFMSMLVAIPYDDTHGICSLWGPINYKEEYGTTFPHL